MLDIFDCSEIVTMEPDNLKELVYLNLFRTGIRELDLTKLTHLDRVIGCRRRPNILVPPNAFRCDEKNNVID